MPTPSAWESPLASTGKQGELRQALQGRTVYFLRGAEDATDLVAADSALATVIPALAFNDHIFFLDLLDSTSAHDGVAVLVSNDGYRYKLSGPIDDFSILDNDLTAPPGSPALGDVYIVGAAATGDWAGQDDKIAIYTARGWEFQTPRVGEIRYIEDEDAFMHYSAGGAWVLGLGTASLPSNTVEPDMILGGRVTWVVENQTTNAPPGSPTDGVQYIIGGSPTGAWAGHAAKLAIAKNSAWIIKTPAVGYKAYDKSTGQTFVYNGSGWISDAGAYVTRYSSFTAALTSQTVENNTTASNTTRGYSYSDTSAPTTSSEERVQSLLTTAITAKKAGALFEVDWQGSIVVSGNVSGGSNNALRISALGVWVDNESAARDWVRLPVELETIKTGNYTDEDLRVFMVRLGFTLADTAAHTIRLRWMLRIQSPGGNTHQFTALKSARQSVIIREVF